MGGVMTGITRGISRIMGGGGGDEGKPPDPPPPAELSDPAIRAAKLMERRRQLGLHGRGSTWLTGARGDTNEPTTAKTTLLGS
jgi:hypothetical protein